MLCVTNIFWTKHTLGNASFGVVSSDTLRGLPKRGPRPDECDSRRRTGEPERSRQPVIQAVRHTGVHAIAKPQTGGREAQRDQLLLSVSWPPPLGSTRVRLHLLRTPLFDVS